MNMYVFVCVVGTEQVCVCVCVVGTPACVSLQSFVSLQWCEAYYSWIAFLLTAKYKRRNDNVQGQGYHEHQNNVTYTFGAEWKIKLVLSVL